MTKAVAQAAYSTTPLRVDASIGKDLTFAMTQCGNASFSIPFKLANTGLAPLKSVNVTAITDNGTPLPLPTGITTATPLAPGASKTLYIPVSTYQPGQHTIVH